MTDYVKALLQSIGENNGCIKKLLQEKYIKLNAVKSAMDNKARNKTPLNKSQVQDIHEFAGLYARERSNLQTSLMGIENTIRFNIEKHSALHIENTEAVLIALATLHLHQNKAIHSLRRMIASSEKTLELLQGAAA